MLIILSVFRRGHGFLAKLETTRKIEPDISNYRYPAIDLTFSNIANPIRYVRRFSWCLSQHHSDTSRCGRELQISDRK